MHDVLTYTSCSFHLSGFVKDGEEPQLVLAMEQPDWIPFKRDTRFVRFSISMSRLVRLDKIPSVEKNGGQLVAIKSSVTSTHIIWRK